MTKRQAEGLLHDAHLRYQRQRLNGSLSETTNERIRRGTHRQPSAREIAIVWQQHWLTGLRPNFYKAYFETIIYMTS